MSVLCRGSSFWTLQEFVCLVNNLVALLKLTSRGMKSLPIHELFYQRGCAWVLRYKLQHLTGVLQDVRPAQAERTISGKRL